MKRVKDLVPGDAIVVDGVQFVVKCAANLPNGKTTILFEDIDCTEENMEAYGKLLLLMKQMKKEEEQWSETNTPDTQKEKKDTAST